MPEKDHLRAMEKQKHDLTFCRHVEKDPAEMANFEIRQYFNKLETTIKNQEKEIQAKNDEISFKGHYISELIETVRLQEEEIDRLNGVIK